MARSLMGGWGARALGRLRLELARALIRLLAQRYGLRPVPFRAMLALRRLAACRDAFLPAWASATWVVDPAGLDFLHGCLRRLAPVTVLEFGSGDSTVLMARVLAEVHDDSGVHVFSVEQDAGFAGECRARLQAEGLNATVAHCELVGQPAADGETLSYDLSPTFIGSLLPAGGPDLIVIDGPSGGRQVRYPVLPGIQRQLVRETPFLLHDGLRDYELRVSAAWAKLPGVSIAGVHVVGEGWVAGTVAPAAHVAGR